MKYYIITTLDRILNDSYKQINYELVIDYNKSYSKIFKQTLLKANTINEDCVIMEDDIILCKDFENRIKTIINEHPNTIINFFTRPEKYGISDYTYDFCYNCCTYFPKNILNDIVNIIQTRNICDDPERLMRNVLKMLKYKHYVVYPPLVQHMDVDSLMNHKLKFKRRSPYFIDYLDELGITYEEAKLEENKEKLIALMEEKFKELDKK